MTSFQKKTGLGRGLSALLDDSENNNTNSQKTDKLAEISPKTNNIGEINISEIETNPYQPRTEFDEIALKELSESIKVQGLIQPITVRANGKNSYQLISGERRFRASKLAGLTTIPAYIRSADDQQMLEMALIENIQRENLNAIEVALSFQRMMEECNLKQEELGDRVGKNRTTVTNYLRLLKLPIPIQISIRDKKISMGHARALININSEEKQLEIHQEILSNDLSVRKVEELVRNLEKPSEKNKPEKSPLSISNDPISEEYQKLQDDLASRFSSDVKLKLGKNGKGNIEIPFVSNEDLNRIIALLDW